MHENADRVRMLSKPGRPDLWLECEEDVFVRCLQALMREGVVAETEADQIRMITIRKGINPIPIKGQRRLWDQLALAGCALICCAVLMVLSIGIGTLMGWFS